MSHLIRSISSLGPLLLTPGSRQLSIALTATGAGGSTTTFIDGSRLTQAADDCWKGATITFTSGAVPPTGNNGTTRVITAFNASTRVLTWVGAIDVAIVAGDTATIVYPARPGPSKVRLYSATISGTVTGATTGCILTIQDCEATPNVLSKWYFATPTGGPTSFSGTAIFGDRGVILDVPMGINAVAVFSGAGTIISTDMVYSFDLGAATDSHLDLAQG